MLECTKDYLSKNKKFKRFHQISTDEVFGDLHKVAKAPDENSPYIPSSPYSASKASSDHLVTSWGRTYKIPYSISICTNNYGPRQFPEKLIPKTIINAMKGKKIPIYGDGKQIRDWLYVKDHCSAIRAILDKGSSGETYNIGGSNEKTNLEVVYSICDILDNLKPNLKGNSYRELITYVKDRPGHDKRYAINSEKISQEIGWTPKENFESGISKTVYWYLENTSWLKELMSEEFRSWVEFQYK